jgi:hypothetical protein
MLLRRQLSANPPLLPPSTILVDTIRVPKRRPTDHRLFPPRTKTGQKRVKEDWENIYYYGFGGGMLLGAVLIYYKPDTRYVLLSLLSVSLSGRG